MERKFESESDLLAKFVDINQEFDFGSTYKWTFMKGNKNIVFIYGKIYIYTLWLLKVNKRTSLGEETVAAVFPQIRLCIANLEVSLNSLCPECGGSAEMLAALFLNPELVHWMKKKSALILSADRIVNRSLDLSFFVEPNQTVMEKHKLRIWC